MWLVLMALFMLCVGMVGSSYAAVADLFTGIGTQITGLETNVQTVLLAAIGLALLFVGARYALKAIRAAH